MLGWIIALLVIAVYSYLMTVVIAYILDRRKYSNDD